MNEKSIRSIFRVSLLVTFAAVVFYLFFQVSKTGPFRDINPFALDPYDAIGSFAIQGALLIGVLTYARSLRLLHNPAQTVKARLILRGNSLVLTAILFTLIVDTVAEFLHPSPPSFWGNLLRVELGLMFALTLTSAVALALVFRPIRTTRPPKDLTPADGIDDLWTLVSVPATKIGRYLPDGLVKWVQCFNSDQLFERIPWINPRLHPWRFAFALGLLVGIGLMLLQLQEGLPPSLQVALLVSGIFMLGELAATLLGFAVLGGYLGLRPLFSQSKKA